MEFKCKWFYGDAEVVVKTTNAQLAVDLSDKKERYAFADKLLALYEELTYDKVKPDA